MYCSRTLFDLATTTSAKSRSSRSEKSVSPPVASKSRSWKALVYVQSAVSLPMRVMYGPFFLPSR